MGNTVETLDDSRGEDPAEPLPAVDESVYTVQGEVGRGGLGRVLRVHDARLGRSVAVKELLHGTPEHRRRFLREARITARLQHPSIVPIYEVGRWPGGEPYYAMKLVSGEPLSERIAAARDLPARLALLPSVIAVAEAVAYAHSEGVIHRDLKPSNILCGAFGETIVIDWGAAKDLRAGDREGADAHAIGSEPADTVAGAVVGTAVYMPPEQASGDSVDERADVYALGATLYHALGGAPPYRGESATEVLAQVRTAPPPPLPAPIPRELRTIVAKAMARAPAERYPTAKELADDLERYATGQLVRAHDYSLGARLARFVRKNRAAVLVAATLLGVLVAGAIVSVRQIVHERDVARRERDAAETQRAAGERVIQAIVADLSRKLRPIGRLALLRGVSDEIEAYYGVIGARAGLDALSETHRAAALELLGDARAAADNRAGAEDAYRQSLEIRARQVGATPQDIATLLLKIGNVEDGAGHGDGALVWQGASRLLLARSCALRPWDDECARSLEGALDDFGQNLASRGQHAAARATFEQERDLAERLATAYPDRLDDTLRLYDTRLSVARAKSLDSDQAGALADLQADLPRLEELARAHKDVRVAATLWRHQRVAGELLEWLARPVDAAASFRAALAVLDRLSRDNPDDTTLQSDSAILDELLAGALEGSGDVTGATAAARASVAIFERLGARVPTRVSWLSGLAAAHLRLANELFDARDVDAAKDLYQAAVADARRLVALEAHRPSSLSILMETLHREAVVLTQEGDLDGATAAYREILRLDEELLALDPRWPDAPMNAINAHRGLAEVATRRSDNAGSIAELEAALAGLRGLVAQFPQRKSHQRDLMQTLTTAGDVLRVLKRLDEAAADLEEARRIGEGLGGDDSAWLEARQEMADLHNATGRLLAAQDQLPQAIASFTIGIAGDRRLVAEIPQDVGFAGRMIHAELSLGDVEIDAGHDADARATYQTALADAIAATGRAPTWARGGLYVAHAYERLSHVDTGAVAHADLEAAADALRKVAPEKRTTEMKDLLRSYEQRLGH